MVLTLSFLDVSITIEQGETLDTIDWPVVKSSPTGQTWVVLQIMQLPKVFQRRIFV